MQNKRLLTYLLGTALARKATDIMCRVDVKISWFMSKIDRLFCCWQFRTIDEKFICVLYELLSHCVPTLLVVIQPHSSYTGDMILI